MGRIAVLDRNMVNMIAAGEVIERPASVVKELMENSIDAGATRIAVGVEDGGKKLISVADDGCGMDAEDLARAFEPHATSKIRTSSDLSGISTLGFRGEALASIASVSQIRAVSRTPDSAGANCIEIDCGKMSPVAPCSADRGTTIQVREIFYKLPARRKFLRTANTEMGHIAEQFTRIALGCYGAQDAGETADSTRAPLDLTLRHNGRELYRLPAGQSLRERIGALFPALTEGAADDFIDARTNEKGLEIRALLGKPAVSRTTSKFQYVFLNGRFIRDRFISHAIKEAYRGLLEPNRFAVVFLFIRMPFSDYDVNVHPTKIEVRFYNANLVHSQVIGALREKLLGTDLDVHAKLPAVVGSTAAADHSGPEPGRVGITEAMADFFKKHRAAPRQHRLGFGSKPNDAATAAATPTQVLPAIDRPGGRAAETVRQAPRRLLQIHESFIVAQTDEGFVIVDQHAMHERVIYEQLRGHLRQGRLESQRLLMPESFELTEAEAALVEENADLLERLGIELVPFGPRTMAVHSFPVLLAKAEPVDFVRDLLDLLQQRHARPEPQTLLEDVLNMAACKAAVKAGQRLTDGEMQQLLAAGAKAESSNRCPHGRPTTIRFTIRDLEKQFKRT